VKNVYKVARELGCQNPAEDCKAISSVKLGFLTIALGGDYLRCAMLSDFNSSDSSSSSSLAHSNFYEYYSYSFSRRISFLRLSCFFAKLATYFDFFFCYEESGRIAE
jgi:hypothetical protein